MTYEDNVRQILEKHFSGMKAELIEAGKKTSGTIVPEPCDDVISRKDILRKSITIPIAPVVIGEPVHYEEVVFSSDIIEAEKASPKIKRGDWIKIEDAEGKTKTVCNRCYREKENRRTKFCPNCGARMKEWDNV